MEPDEPLPPSGPREALLGSPAPEEAEPTAEDERPLSRGFYVAAGLSVTFAVAAIVFLEYRSDQTAHPALSPVPTLRAFAPAAVSRVAALDVSEVAVPDGVSLTAEQLAAMTSVAVVDALPEPSGSPPAMASAERHALRTHRLVDPSFPAAVSSAAAAARPGHAPPADD